MINILADALLTASRQEHWEKPRPRPLSPHEQRAADRRQMRAWLRDTGSY